MPIVQLAAFDSTPPEHVSVPAQHEGPGVETAITFGSAAAGAFLGVALQAYVSRRGSRRHFEALLRSLSAEITQIEATAAARAQKPFGDLRLDPPYPTEAWLSLVRSPESRRLADSYDDLAEFYLQVLESNHRLQSVSTLVHIAATAPDDGVRLAFRQMAFDSSSSVNREILNRLPQARAAVGRLLEGL